MSFFAKLKLKKMQKQITALCKARQHNPVPDIELKKEIALHLQVAKFYDERFFNKKFPYAEDLAQESYRAAAELGDTGSQYILGKRLLEKAKFWDGFKKSLFKTPIHEKYAKDFYQEAHGYLKQAEEQGYPLAIRLVGLSYINGWGFTVDQDKGFQLVVDSIEREGSWDKATQIFTELGLNKSEFFSSIMSMRKAKNR